MMHLNGNVWFPARGEQRSASPWLDYSTFIDQQLLFPLILKWPLLMQSLAGHLMSSTSYNALLLCFATLTIIIGFEPSAPAL